MPGKVIIDGEIGMEMIQDVSEDAAPRDGTEGRGKWSRHLDYILSMVGFCVGFGNLWRFPYVCNRNGGGAFLIPYVLFLIITAFPMFFLEASISQFSGKGTVHVWSFCPMLKGVGVGATLVTAFAIPYYNILLAWPIYYMVKSCSSILPWTTCGNSWNTDLCVEDARNSTYNFTVLTGNASDPRTVAEMWDNATLAHTATEEFWQYNVLKVSSGLEEVGNVQWPIVGCLFASYVIMFLCLCRGVKSVGKVVYVTALLPYILLTVIFIRTLMLPGSGSGVLYYLVPDFSKLLHVQVWLEACLQVFYSLGPGWGMIGTPASYNKFHEPCLRDSMILSAISEGTSMFSGLVTFAVLGVMSEKTGVPIAGVVSSGPGLGYVTYPEALSQLPFPQLWSFMFFLMLLTVGLDSQFMGLEVVTTAIVDQYPRMLFNKRYLVTGAVCLLDFLFGILLCTQGGPYIFQLLDWYISAFSVFVFCTLECFAVVWIYGIKQISTDIEMMLGKPLARPMRILWAFVTPAVMIATLILTLLRYEPPTYGKYKFPAYASTIGWFVATFTLIPLPVFLVISVKQHLNQKSVRKIIHSAMKPDDKWLPSDVRYRKAYRENIVKANYSMRNNMKDIFE
ncbi:sodium- and chloride-dependent glycine transporter 1-like [Haliotis cracherodii]|uniref:sodium- and chloride-dependent glycine transporter 1-like n=1 Tax=Haliotis cracherodii TaxID=6455 RepID=UPI0039E8300E